MSKVLSWGDRFALIDHYKPTDAAICAAFKLSSDELDTARQLRTQGMFHANANLDVSKFSSMFSAPAATPATPQVAVTATPQPTINTATVHSRPESASKKAKEPQKRGRKGNKITSALQAVPTNPVAIDAFIKEHGVSLAVLRQSKRFIEKMDPVEAATIGTVHVRQDKGSKTLMIWRSN